MKHRLKIALILGIPIAILTLAIFLSGSTFTRAGVDNNVAGYAWSSNVGWISLNNCRDTSDPATCVGDSYGVNYDLATGQWSGRGWNNALGWVTFGVSGPGAGPWARFDVGGTAGSAGWEGYIDLSRVTLNQDTMIFSGYGWDGNNDDTDAIADMGAGWIDFSWAYIGDPPPPDCDPATDDCDPNPPCDPDEEDCDCLPTDPDYPDCNPGGCTPGQPGCPIDDCLPTDPDYPDCIPGGGGCALDDEDCIFGGDCYNPDKLQLDVDDPQAEGAYSTDIRWWSPDESSYTVCRASFDWSGLKTPPEDGSIESEGISLDEGEFKIFRLDCDTASRTYCAFSDALSYYEGNEIIGITGPSCALSTEETVKIQWSSLGDPDGCIASWSGEEVDNEGEATVPLTDGTSFSIQCDNGVRTKPAHTVEIDASCTNPFVVPLLREI